MLLSQKLQIRLSEIREKLNGLLQTENRTEKQSVELQTLSTEAMRVEPEYRAALIIDDASKETGESTSTSDPEVRERAEIRSRFSGVTEFFDAALRGHMPSGAAAEFAASLGCRSHETPIQLIVPPETRAVTDAPTSGTTLQPTTPAVFPRSLHAELGVLTPLVPPGQAGFPVISTNVVGSAKVHLKGVAADATAGVMTTKSVSPRRLPGTITVAVEDLALLPTLEQDLQRNLQDVLGDLYDQIIINGQAAEANVAPAITGLIGFTTAPSAEGTKDLFPSYASKFLGSFDGMLANGPGELIGLVGTDVAKVLLKTFSTTAPLSAWAHLVANMRSVRAWKHLKSLSSNVAPVYVVQAGVEGRCSAPIWGGMELVRDIYGTNATQGQISVTATMLIGDPQELRNGFVVPLSVKTA